MRLHCLLVFSCVSAISRSIPNELVQYGSPSLVVILVTPQCRLSSLVVRCLLLVLTHAPILHCFLAISCVSVISRSIPNELVLYSFPFSCGHPRKASVQTICFRSALSIAHRDPCGCIASSLSIVCLLSLVA